MSHRNSKSRQWTAHALGGLAVTFLMFDAGIKVLQLGPAVEGTAALGYPAGAVLGIGLVELACIALYVIPRTSFLGAVLLTGYLGGAVASHVRVESPLFSHTLFPIYVAAMIWGALYLRDVRTRIVLAARVPA